jgi:hypothetical protein
MNEEGSVASVLNRSLGAYWTAMPQHQAHVALLASWGIIGLSEAMVVRTLGNQLGCLTCEEESMRPENVWLAAGLRTPLTRVGAWALLEASP